MDETNSLPKNFALATMFNENYLRYVHDNNEILGFLQTSGEKVVSPYTKFEVEDAKIGDGLVHIRCCYNNKYWVLSSPSSHYIVAAANEPEEDRSKYSCTLFKPMYDEERMSYRFRHVYLDHILHQHWKVGKPHYNCLFANSSKVEEDDSDLFIIIDWDSLFILPKYVAFKGNNGYYLKSYNFFGAKYLQFSSSDINEPRVRNEVFMTPDGHVRIKNISTRKFWVREPNWIFAKSTETETDDANTVFWPVKLDDNGVALRNKGNNQFCKRVTQDGKDDCLTAGINYISDEARLEIAELVLSRDIYNVDFRLSDARIYSEKPLVMTSGVVENNTTVADKLSLKLSYEDTHTLTWSSTVSTKLGVEMTIETGVPKIAGGEIEISGEISDSYAWGATQQSKTLIEVVHDIVVPPSTKVKTSIVATQGACDIPFSYTQSDKLTNGKIVHHRFDDGIFTGVNCYNYQFVTEEL